MAVAYFEFIYGCTSIFGQRRFVSCWQFSATASCREYLHHGVTVPCPPLDRSSLAVLAPPAIGTYRFLTRRESLIYCDRLFSQYEASHLSEASCLTGSNELDTAKMTVIRMKLLIALGHRIISVHVAPKKPVAFVSFSFILFSTTVFNRH